MLEDEAEMDVRRQRRVPNVVVQAMAMLAMLIGLCVLEGLWVSLKAHDFRPGGKMVHESS